MVESNGKLHKKMEAGVFLHTLRRGTSEDINMEDPAARANDVSSKHFIFPAVLTLSFIVVIGIDLVVALGIESWCFEIVIAPLALIPHSSSPSPTTRVPNSRFSQFSAFKTERTKL